MAEWLCWARLYCCELAGTAPDVFDPFSLINALSDMELANYWFATGTPTRALEESRNNLADIAVDA